MADRVALCEDPPQWILTRVFELDPIERQMWLMVINLFIDGQNSHFNLQMNFASGPLFNHMLRVLKREGIPFNDREHVTPLAFYLVRGWE